MKLVMQPGNSWPTWEDPWIKSSLPQKSIQKVLLSLFVLIQHDMRAPPLKQQPISITKTVS